MGNLLGGVSFREHTTVEDCDSTWQTDSEPELEQPGPVGGGEGPEHDEPERSEQPPKGARGRPAPAQCTRNRPRLQALPQKEMLNQREASKLQGIYTSIDISTQISKISDIKMT